MLKKSNQKGFTIIEVLIVLAIAALIMLVVFLAVPALRRNQANSARQTDASRVSSAVTECLSNRNGDPTGCGSTANIDVGDTSQLLWDATSVINTAASPSGSKLAALTPDADATKVQVTFYAKCNNDGTAAATTNKRDFVVLYNKKGSGAGLIPVCIGS